MRVCVFTEVPAHSPRAPSQPQGFGRPLLHTHQDVPHQHAVLQREGTNNIRQDPGHGCRSLRVLMRSLLDPPLHILWKLPKEKVIPPHQPVFETVKLRTQGIADILHTV